MAYYLIHTCFERVWYVQQYLIPTMLNQGISKDNISVYLDKNRIGNLRAWIDSCNRAIIKCEEADIDGLWHLQDDVIISNVFAEQTAIYDRGLVCGFTCAYDTQPEVGTFMLKEEKMWFSFPCIRIPTDILKAFTMWANCNLWQSKYFKNQVHSNNGDDLVFREWLYDNYPDMQQLNLYPNLVNHIDTYLGGSVCNKQRDPVQDTMSIFWVDNGELEVFKKFISTVNLTVDNSSNI